MNVTPHRAQKAKYSAFDERTTRQSTYQVSRQVRKQVEELFGRMKTTVALSKLLHRGTQKVSEVFVPAAAA